jgi:replicative DNA helicase
MSDVSVTRIVLNNLVTNEDYVRKVLPFIDPSYFQDAAERVFFTNVQSYFVKYNSLPSMPQLKIEIAEDKTTPEPILESTIELCDDVGAMKNDAKNLDWLFDKTEKFCREQAVYNAAVEAVEIIEGKGTKTKHELPSLFEKALAVSFDTNVGHAYFENATDRFSFYHSKDKKVRTHLDILNKVMDGGPSEKTLNMILAGTNAGKTALMCDLAANNLQDGKNVLYITLEMAEERIAERIDANLFDMEVPAIRQMTERGFMSKIAALKSKTIGKLFIKEYAPASATTINFEHLLNEYRTKKGFQPAVIYVDYMNLMSSARVKNQQNINSAMYYKLISEELRGLAVKFGIPIWTANQFNRGGYNNSDADLTDIADSFATAMGADFIMALIRTEQLDELDQVLIKQLKSRYSDMAKNRSFTIGVDRSKFKYYDVDQSGAADDDKPVMDSSKTGTRQKAEKTKTTEIVVEFD